MPRTSMSGSSTSDSLFSLALSASSASTVSSSGGQDDKEKSSTTTTQTPTITTSIRNVKVALPRRLGKPKVKRVSREAIESIDPDLANVPLAYTIDTMHALGPRMMDALRRTTAPPPNALPRELTVSVLPDPDSEFPQFDVLPTHLFAIYSRSDNSSSSQGKVTARRKVTLFPTHAIIWVIHCANLPLLSTANQPDTSQTPQSTVSEPSRATGTEVADSVATDAQGSEGAQEPVAGPSTLPEQTEPATENAIEPVTEPSTTEPATGPKEMTLPVIPLCIPSPPTFPILQTYLYTKRVDQLFASLMPNAVAQSMSEMSSAKELSQELADILKAEDLVRGAMQVHGLWANVSALGVFDEVLWQIIHLTWRIFVEAIELIPKESDSSTDEEACSTGSRESDSRTRSSSKRPLDVEKATSDEETTSKKRMASVHSEDTLPSPTPSELSKRVKQD